MQILELAGEDGPAATFAHHRLAELLLEHNPWRAALHLRRLNDALVHNQLAPQEETTSPKQPASKPQSASDDEHSALSTPVVIHALTGLCHVLLGNYRVSVAAYKKALALDEGNPWYQHNIGHLLDVALDMPEAAEEYLRAAVSKLSRNHEVMASLAHCLGRIGRLDEAKALARRAAGESVQHQALLQELTEVADPGATSRASVSALSSGQKRLQEQGEHIVEGACAYLHGHGQEQVNRGYAQALWDEYQTSKTSLRISKPEVCMAALVCAIEWAISDTMLHRGSLAYGSASAQAERVGKIASDFGVSARAARSRFSAICKAWEARSPATEQVTPEPATAGAVASSSNSFGTRCEPV